jgi:hypothetical protein
MEQPTLLSLEILRLHKWLCYWHKCSTMCGHSPELSLCDACDAFKTIRISELEAKLDMLKVNLTNEEYSWLVSNSEFY